jgi:hypothetical protein
VASKSPDQENKEIKSGDAETPVNGTPVNGALDLAGVLNEHKGKLAMGVAATLGLMVFYSWRERQLAKEDPEAHALHQKSKAIVKAAETKAHRPSVADEGYPVSKVRTAKDSVPP